VYDLPDINIFDVRYNRTQRGDEKGGTMKQKRLSRKEKEMAKRKKRWKKMVLTTIVIAISSAILGLMLRFFVIPLFS